MTAAFVEDPRPNASQNPEIYRSGKNRNDGRKRIRGRKRKGRNVGIKCEKL